MANSDTKGQPWHSDRIVRVQFAACRPLGSNRTAELRTPVYRQPARPAIHTLLPKNMGKRLQAEHLMFSAP